MTTGASEGVLAGAVIVAEDTALTRCAARV